MAEPQRRTDYALGELEQSQFQVSRCAADAAAWAHTCTADQLVSLYWRYTGRGDRHNYRERVRVSSFPANVL